MLRLQSRAVAVSGVTFAVAASAIGASAVVHATAPVNTVATLKDLFTSVLPFTGGKKPR
jgi:hypothetical protein